MKRPWLSRQRELELLELRELAWRGFIIVSVVCLSATPWVALWSWL
jgi:hypothetical protein